MCIERKKNEFKIRLVKFKLLGGAPQQRYQYLYHNIFVIKLIKKKQNLCDEQSHNDWGDGCQYKACTHESKNEGWLSESVGLHWWYDETVSHVTKRVEKLQRNEDGAIFSMIPSSLCH